MKTLGMAFLFSVATVWGQQSPTMPEPLPQVEYVGELPSWMVEVYKTQNGVVLESPQTNFAAGSIPRGRMIILSEVEQAPENNAQPQPKVPAHFYLRDNIWKDSRWRLEQFYDPPPIPFVWDLAGDIAKYNEVKVPAWKLNGKT